MADAPPGRDKRSSRLAGQSLTEYRRYTLHALLVILPIIAAVSEISARASAYPFVFSGVASSRIADSGGNFIGPPLALSTESSVLARHQAEARATAPPSSTAALATPTQTASPEATSTPQQPAFLTYTVQPGDSVSAIASSFGIDPNYVLWNNPEIRDDPDLLIVGANVLVPSVNGIVYTLALGDTLSDVAAYYQIDIQSITAFAPNQLSSPDDVIEGMVLVLPGAVPPPPPPPPPLPEPPAEVAPEPAPAPVVSSGSAFIWPFYGSISTYFGEPRGAGYHLGIDIDGFGSYGAPVAAAAPGRVILVAYQDWGYGYHVILEHADGSRTMYAHMSDIYVVQGQLVVQGEALGAIGSTGYSTGPHLHFELWISGSAVDPVAYLQ